MRILIAVCIYDRYQNLERWINAWIKSERAAVNTITHQMFNCELVIVHNQDQPGPNRYQELCERFNVTYIPRKNTGFGTGIIQDLFKNRLPGVGYWDYLLFATDDTIPMSPVFVWDFLDPFEGPGKTGWAGLTCMEISGVYTPHVRTTGFMIPWEVAQKIEWWRDPVETKEDDYFFEHQGFQDTLMAQVLCMGLQVIQLSEIRKSVMWDTHHNADHDRMDEFMAAFSCPVCGMLTGHKMSCGRNLENKAIHLKLS